MGDERATEWFCGYRIDFKDGGPPEGEILHIGSEAECEDVAERLPAVAYSGRRPVAEATMLVGPLPEQE